MGTILDTPVQTGRIVAEQKIVDIRINLDRNVLAIEISGDDNTEDRIHSVHHEVPIWDDEGSVDLPAAVETAGRDLLQALTTVAKNQGWIGTGTTTDDL